MDLYLYRDEKQTGPYTEANARALVVAGEIARTCLAWQEGLAEWVPLETVITLPAPPAQSTFPAGPPPVPTRTPQSPPKGDLIKQVEGQLERMAGTKHGRVIERHGGWVFHVCWLLLLLVIIPKCHHG